MTAVPVEIASPPLRADQDAREGREAEEVEFLDDIDAVASTAAMLGCGDDNPYR